MSIESIKLYNWKAKRKNSLLHVKAEFQWFEGWWMSQWISILKYIFVHVAVYATKFAPNCQFNSNCCSNIKYTFSLISQRVCENFLQSLQDTLFLSLWRIALWLIKDIYRVFILHSCYKLQQQSCNKQWKTLRIQIGLWLTLSDFWLGQCLPISKYNNIYNATLTWI